MKRFNQLSLALVAVAAVSSCTTLSHEATTAKVDTRIVSMTVGDMNVSKEKASATAEWKWSPFSAVKPEEIRLTATAKLLRETNSDVIVEPVTDIRRRGLFRGGTVTVTGYPATYTGFHPMTESEAKAYAIANSRLCPTTTATYATTPAGKPKTPKALKVRKERKPFNNGSFLDATYGFTHCADWSSGSAGLVYGHYCSNRWGWYIRGSIDWGAGYDRQHLKDRIWVESGYSESGYHSAHYEKEYCEDAHRNCGGSISAGVLFGCSNKFGLFLGAGIGGAVINYSASENDFNHSAYNNYTEGCRITKPLFGEVRAVAPVEVGVNFRFDALNIMAGYRCSICLEDDIDHSPSTVFVGVGINF